MRRRTAYVLCALLVVGLLGSGSPKEYDDKTEFAGIEGTWQLIEYEFEGGKWNPDARRVVISHSGSFTFKQNADSWGGTYRIDLTHNPSHLDEIQLLGNSRSETKSIFQINVNILRTANMLGPTDVQRPKRFNDMGVITWTYKRVK